MSVASTLEVGAEEGAVLILGAVFWLALADIVAEDDLADDALVFAAAVDAGTASRFEVLDASWWSRGR